MARVVLTNLVLFLLPFLVYGAYVRTTGRSKTTADAWADAPVLALLAAGMVLVFIAMITFASFRGGAPSGHYQPPVYENGQIKPGTIQ